MSLKQKVFDECIAYVEKRNAAIQETINSYKSSLESETKSTAGDKHETGRAMVQLEMEKASQQVEVIQQMREVLAKIDISQNSTQACLGSLVTTQNGTYFLAISLGKITVEEQDFFVISIASPIGKAILGKTVGENILFNGNSIEILAIQ